MPAIWSSNYLIARAAAPHVPPHLLAFGRWALVALVLLAWQARGLWRDPARAWAERWQLLALGALGMWICGAWVYLGGRSTSAVNIGLIYAAAPVGIALGSQWLLGERLSAAQRGAMVLALAGVVYVVVGGRLEVLLAVRLSAGDAWIVGATLAWIAYSLLLRRWPTRLSDAERLAGCALGGLVVMAPFAAWEAVAAALAGGRPTATALGLVGLAALLPGLLAYLAYGFLQRELGAARAALVMYLAPVYAAVLAWLLLDEAPQPHHAVGALLILPAIHFATRRG